MALNSLSSFLDRFKKFTSPNKVTHEAIIKVLYNTLGIKLNKSAINIKNQILYIKTNSVIKNEIFLHKEQILQNLRDKLKKQSLKDIF
ncbi:hypothetical protein KJ973_02125 [Patescibacteria group bacterium]|nr:hypothetical protein [Patescibacteria group bacterium]MBU1246566.1 hypothetical protein [Patescibacteria group bacterium]MBU1519465.1 hypothetical protein [Patescibacteria group bacterium]MBU1730555.1 hypothetical protein [Patescibacteria group bacterium]MBU1956326.1 hypothetical protein [Patescibacteria group bacterium]